jgi:hypothetical protein
VKEGEGDNEGKERIQIQKKKNVQITDEKKVQAF